MLDSNRYRATSSVISRSFLQTISIYPNVTLHSARGADKNRLNVEGEIELTLNFGELKLPITALVLNSLDCDILAGHVCFNHSLNADLVLPRFAHALIL